MAFTRQAERPANAPLEGRPVDSPDRIRQAPLLFTLKDACPARLCAEDLRDPLGFQKRLEEWLLRQR